MHFHDYTFFYPQFTLIAQHRFPEHVAGRCEMLAIRNRRRQGLLVKATS